MNKETEIKLRASRETLAALQTHPLLKKRSKSCLLYTSPSPRDS